MVWIWFGFGLDLVWIWIWFGFGLDLDLVWIEWGDFITWFTFLH
jgi:hypothetical protein